MANNQSITEDTKLSLIPSILMILSLSCLVVAPTVFAYRYVSHEIGGITGALGAIVLINAVRSLGGWSKPRRNKIRLTHWEPVPGAPCHCMRIVEGASPYDISARKAFIDTVPRVKLPNGFWHDGPEGWAGSGDAAENQIYGYFGPSRNWCDAELKKMGYELL